MPFLTTLATCVVVLIVLDVPVNLNAEYVIRPAPVIALVLEEPIKVELRPKSAAEILTVEAVPDARKLVVTTEDTEPPIVKVVALRDCKFIIIKFAVSKPVEDVVIGMGSMQYSIST